MTVDQLKPGTLGHNLIVKVVTSQIVVDKARPDGSKVKVAEAVVGDHTGCITLTARNSNIPLLLKFKIYKYIYIYIYNCYS